MIPSNDSFIKLEGDVAILGDPLPRHRFPLLADGPGPAPGLRTTTILADSGPWDISYDKATGRIIDITEAAMPDLSPAESEAVHAVS